MCYFQRQRSQNSLLYHYYCSKDEINQISSLKHISAWNRLNTDTMFSYIINKKSSFLGLEMESTFNQLENSSTLLSFIYSLPFLGGYSVQYIFPTSFGGNEDYDGKNMESQRILPQNSFTEEYKSQSKRNIILDTKQAHTYEKLKNPKINDSEEETTKILKKPLQKDTRNINSNLMRIFLKNLIELKEYTQKIDVLLKRYGSNLSKEKFYLWIENFGINFKNYIRFSQVSKIVAKQEPQLFRRIFLILLDDYSREIGLRHSLTSKRIDRNSIKMHLEGLRCLSRDLMKFMATKN